MKRNIIAVLVAATLFACNMSDKSDKKETKGALTEEQKKQAEADTTNFTTIQWLDSTSLKLGTVKKGEVVEVSFKFKNTGDKQLVITNVSAGCGCTVPEVPQHPFAPGEEGVIKAAFNSSGQQAGVPHTKSVTVSANTKPATTHHLNFTVEITE